MKYFSPILALFFFISCATKSNISANEILIYQNFLSKVGNNFEMKIAKIISDSRCPEGANCVWAGEVQLEIAIYNKQNKVTFETLTISSKKLEQNKAFFANYLSPEKSIKEILILPAKKQNGTTVIDCYILKVNFK